MNLSTVARRARDVRLGHGPLVSYDFPNRSASNALVIHPSLPN